MISCSFSLHHNNTFLVSSPKSSIQNRLVYPPVIRNRNLDISLKKTKHAIYAKCCDHLNLGSKTASSPVLKSLLPFAASIAIILWSHPAEAGFLSGYTGIESVPGPELPKVEFLERFNEENQKRYADLDAKFKESPILKKLLEKSKENKEKNKQEIQDKYCLRGAEWGVGDCSAEGMTPDERDKFIATLKQKVGIKE